MKKIDAIFLVPFLAVIVSCADEVENSLLSTSSAHLIEDEVIETEPATFLHPMQQGMTPKGIILQDVKNDENDMRYAIGERINKTIDGRSYVKSGIFALERSTISESDIFEAEQVKGSDRTSIQTIKKVSSKLREEISANGESRASLYIKNHDDYESITKMLEAAMAEGRINSLEDRKIVREQLVKSQQDLVASKFSEVLPKFALHDIEVVNTCKSLYCMQVILNEDKLNYIESLDDVLVVDHIRKVSNNHIKGREISNGMQLRQFQDVSYLGDKSSSTYGIVNVGILEHGDLEYLHDAFLDYRYNGTIYSRIAQSITCGFWCSGQITSSSGNQKNQHASAVTFLAAGDLTDQQSPIYTSTNDRIDRSGYGRESEIYFWRAKWDLSIDNALDSIVTHDIQVLNISIAYDDEVHDCDGDSVVSLLVNDLYKAGITSIVASGNNGHSFYDDCRVEIPADSNGAFTVGSYIGNWEYSNEEEVRRGTIASFSDRGGTVSEGNRRTIIDVVAPGSVQYASTIQVNNFEPFTGTSASAPIVTGAAVNLIDFYRYNYSNAIDTPGKLTAHLLAMGDREGEYGVINTGFSNLWGAGRLKMRRWDSKGLDDPYDWFSLSTCIDDGESYYVYFNGGNNIPLNADDLKVVVFWHNVTGFINDIDLVLESKRADGTWYSHTGSYDSFDDKERVFTNNVGGKSWRVRVSGYDVRYDSESICGGGNSTRVHIVGFYEDDARDDPQGPYLNNSPSSGVDVDRER